MFDFIDVTTLFTKKNKMASAGENEMFASLSSKQSLLENRDIFSTKQCAIVLAHFCSAKELDSGRLLKNTKDEVAEFLKNKFLC